MSGQADGGETVFIDRLMEERESGQRAAEASDGQEDTGAATADSLRQRRVHHSRRAEFLCPCE